MQTPEMSSLHAQCAGSAWGGVNFLHSRRYGTMFLTGDQKSVDSSPAF